MQNQVASSFNQMKGMQQEFVCKTFNDMNSSFNNFTIASCVVTNILTKVSEVPALFVIMDFTGAFALLSVYNASEKVYNCFKAGSQIRVMNPYVKKLEV